MKPGSGGRRTRLLLCLAAVVLLAVVLRIPPSLKKQVFNVDEGTLAAVAGVILDGGVPYRDSWDTRGPVVFYVYAAAFSLCGRNDMLAVHLAAFLAVVLTALLLILLGRELGREGAGLLAGPLYVLLTFTYLPLDMLAANCELFMVLFSTAGVLAFARSRRSGYGPGFFLGGVLLGLSFLTKQPALLDFAGLLALLLLVPGPGAGLRGRLAPAGWMAAGFALPVAGAVSFFASRGALPEFIFGFWTYSSRYFLPAIPAAERLRMVWKGPWPLVRDNAWAWVTALAGMVLATGAARRRGGERALLIPVVWGLTSFVGASSSGRGFGHYYIQLLPPLAFLSAWFTVAILPRLAERAVRLGGAGSPARASDRQVPPAATVLIVMLTAGGYLAPLGTYFHPGSLGVLADAWAIARSPAAERNLRGLNRPLKQLARRIRAGSGPGESIFVWGFHPQAYLVSGRKPASRFSYCIYLTGLVPWVNTGAHTDTSRSIVPGSWDLLMRDLELVRPAFIVDTSPGNILYWRKYPLRKFPRLEAFIADHYALDAQIRKRNGKAQYDLYRRVD